METPPVPASAKRERWRLRKQEKEATRNRANNTRRLKRLGIWTSTVLLIGGVVGFIIWQATSQSPISESDIISRNGLHWHPQLMVTIRGQQTTIPQNIGLGAVHNPIHTHEDLPIIHLEFQGRVVKNDLRLSQFFKAWGKQFSSTCLLDSCNGTEGRLTMTVNGQSSTEFDQYMMQDKDKIELRFE